MHTHTVSKLSEVDCANASEKKLNLKYNSPLMIMDLTGCTGGWTPNHAVLQSISKKRTKTPLMAQKNNLNYLHYNNGSGFKKKNRGENVISSYAINKFDSIW